VVITGPIVGRIINQAASSGGLLGLGTFLFLFLLFIIMYYYQRYKVHTRGSRHPGTRTPWRGVGTCRPLPTNKTNVDRDIHKWTLPAGDLFTRVSITLL
jgi:hypothetical protein